MVFFTIWNLFLYRVYFGWVMLRLYRMEPSIV